MLYKIFYKISEQYEMIDGVDSELKTFYFPT